MSVDMSSYKKAIIKIIYKMTYYWLGERYLNDAMAIKIRDYILSDVLEVNGLFGKVDLVGGKKDGLAILADSDAHIAVLKKDGNRLSCYVNIFNNFYGCLIVAEQVELYLNIEELFLVNDVKMKEIRESALIEEIVKISE
ncbi:TPA: hypothetical protein QCY05_000856 [Bacillus wiedmannii]|nr:hypothetical protein [Bacillus wiedmannii]